jgi:hypothetical protein
MGAALAVWSHQVLEALEDPIQVVWDEEHGTASVIHQSARVDVRTIAAELLFSTWQTARELETTARQQTRVTWAATRVKRQRNQR